MKTFPFAKLYVVLATVISLLTVSCYPPAPHCGGYAQQCAPPRYSTPPCGMPQRGMPPQMGYRPPGYGGGYGVPQQRPVYLSGGYSTGGGVLSYQGSSFGPPVAVTRIR